jgi:malate synthase
MRGTRPIQGRLPTWPPIRPILTRNRLSGPRTSTGFKIGTQNVDAEIATMAGPQLVVPALNDRFVLNAANARWGSLYDALYGTDVLDAPAARPGGYDTARGDAVIAYARKFLDSGSSAGQRQLGRLGRRRPALADPAIPIIRRGDDILLRNNGLGIEIVIDRNHPVGKTDKAGIADVILEAALTTIIDLEDSVAAVDAEDKVARAYTNWLGLMRGDLTASFDKGGKTMTRALEDDREWDGGTAPRPLGHVRAQCRPSDDQPGGAAARRQRSARRHSGRDGHLALIAMHDLKRASANIATAARAASISSSPSMHGPEEVRLHQRRCSTRSKTCSVSTAHTIKVGVMDEERRTSANLAACI